MNDNALDKLYEVTQHLNTATVDDISSILNQYNNSKFNDPMTAARLNARYHELTGQDHPVYMEQAPKVIDNIMSEKDSLLQSDAYTPMYFDRLEQIRGNLAGEVKGMEFAEGHHPLQDFQRVIENLPNATIEQVSQQLDYYNGQPVMIDGIAHHPFNDPMTAARLNARYHELTGQDHPVFMEQQPKVIDNIMSEKDVLLDSGVYEDSYFNALEQMKRGIEQTKMPDLSNATKEELIATREKLEQQEYRNYRDKLNQAYLAEKDPDTFLHSSFTMRDGETPKCDHYLEQIKGQERTILSQRSFDYNENFRQNMLEPAIVDFAERNPISSLDTRHNTTPNNANVSTQSVGQNSTNTPTSDLRAISETNNVLSVNNVQPEYANTVASAVQQVEPTVFQQQMNQQMTQQMSQAGPQLTLQMGGFANILLISLLIGFGCGFLVWFTLMIIK